MLKKTAFSFLLIFMIQFLSSCFICNCPDPKAIKFGFDVAEYEKIIQKDFVKNGIAFTFNLIDNTPIVVKNQSLGTFMPTVMACDCNDPYYGVFESAIVSLKIYTVNELNTTNSVFKPGADVSKLFVGSENYYELNTELYDELEKLKTKLNNLNYYFDSNFPVRKVNKKIGIGV